jgi:transcriptional regulator with XRE-family HTH domain
MVTKAQHSDDYAPLPDFLRRLREEAELTQRDLGERLKKPQSWIYNCECANRRVDLAEFIGWCRACGADPLQAMNRFMTKGGSRRTKK